MTDNAEESGGDSSPLNCITARLSGFECFSMCIEEDQ